VSDKDEISPGGSKIHRHQAKEREFAAAAHADTEEIEQHFAKHFGEPEMVFHEIISDLVHIDVHQIPPRPERNHWTLFTSGMSALPMTVPEGAEDFRFAELVLQLPADWKMDQESFADERWYWPIRWMKQLARLPHQYQTWLGAYHTIPNGDPPQPFSAGTKLCCWFLWPPTGEDAGQIQLADGRTVQVLAMHALHLEEMSLKLNQGGDALIAAMDAAELSEVLDVKRKSLLRKKLFGLF
jgi:hypothetical protein